MDIMSPEAKRETFEAACEWLSRNGEASVRDYSGRGMYGKTTLAITTDARISAADITLAILRAIEEVCGDDTPLGEALAIADEITPRRQDSMGLGAVYY